MSSGGLIIAILFIIIGAAWIFMPLWRATKAQSTTAQTQKSRDELITAYERVLSAIRDLDEDHQTGKLNTKDYEAERAVWVERGVLILQALEQSGGLPTESENAGYLPPTTSADAPLVSADDEVELAIARYVKSRTTTSA
jgi:cytochrome c-type biogenesis protein CcmI